MKKDLNKLKSSKIKKVKSLSNDNVNFPFNDDDVDITHLLKNNKYDKSDLLKLSFTLDDTNETDIEFSPDGEIVNK